MKQKIILTVRMLLLSSLIILSTQIEAQEREISGTVTSAVDGLPLQAVSVVIKGTTTGTSTDIDGKYIITAPEDATLIFSFIGFTTQEIPIEGKTTINIILEEEAAALTEIVVTGYGVQQKKDVTGATASLKTEDFNKGAIISPAEMMQGRIAGVNITGNSGEPGSGATVRIRGIHSIRANQDPLYVIDGVPLDITDASPEGAEAAGINLSGNKNPLNFLNPDDIESIDILKDASATAIYGSRGANGVVFITTKRGTKGKGKLSYSAYGGISTIREKLDILSAREFRDYTSSQGFTISDLGASIDWQDEVFRTAYSHNHNVSYSGGDENSSYRASFGYLNQEGIVKRTNLEKITGRFNFDQKLFEGRLEISSNLTASRTTDNRVPISETGGFEGDVLMTALKLNPTFPIRNQDGTYYQHTKDTRNPVAMIDLTDDETNTDRILGNISATLEIINGLDYKMTLGIDHSSATRRVSQNKELSYLVNDGTADIATIELDNTIIENYFTYKRKMGENHDFNFLIGHSFQKFRNRGHDLFVDGFTVEDKDYTDNLEWGNKDNAEVKSHHRTYELQSFYGRINYNYLDKYLLTTTLRADGSTRFGENNKYGWFPSTSFAWRLGEENFIREMDIFSNLKLRLGWGLTGNQEIPEKISLLSVGTADDAAYFFEGDQTVFSPGITFIRTPNPDLQWETSSQVNIGLDFGIFRGRLSGSVDLFFKRTKDVLLEVTSLLPAPIDRVWLNVPELRIKNTGLEVNLNGVLIEQKDLFWDATLNFSTVKNEVSDLPVSLIETGVASGPGLSNTRVQVITNGEPIGTFWGREFLGYDENGMNIYRKDAEGNDWVGDLGSAIPDFTGSLTTSARYKNFDISIFLYGVFGNKIYNNTANAIFHKNAISKGQNVLKSVTTSSESPGNTPEFSSRFIESGSFVRMGNATLGYTFNKNFLNWDWISSLRLYVSGNNLFVITDYDGFDPEVNNNAQHNDIPSLGIDFTSYPKARTVTFGVNVEF